MIFLLGAAIHLFPGKDNGIDHGLQSRALSDCDPDIDNCRNLYGIAWGCLVTIFACTWVSVHPNVPSPGQSSAMLLLRRIMMMLGGIMAPEIIVFFAARQFFVARRFSKEFGVSKTHGFFFSMGGFVSHAGRHPVTTIRQLKDSKLGEAYLSDIKATNADDIMDKSKGDALSKGIALLQGLWFILQSISRRAVGLPITPLEFATIAFAVLNVFIWLLWWNKPLDVGCPILIGPSEGEPGQAPTYQLQWSWKKIKERGYAGPVSGRYESFCPEESSAVPAFWSSESMISDNTRLIEMAVGVVFGAVHCAGWNTVFPTRIEEIMWKVSSIYITAGPALVLVGQIFTLNFLAPKFSSDQLEVPSFFKGTILPWLKAHRFLGGLLVFIVVSIFTVTLPAYVVARLMLVVIPFTTLRALPVDALKDINWTIYLPHI
ncbi:hypothetical protein C8J56DRAFT_960661 [Mycena floridula]|nr:hypothetical protein C8J56DRAFT_960661 [Mycena floridula]